MYNFVLCFVIVGAYGPIFSPILKDMFWDSLTMGRDRGGLELDFKYFLSKFKFWEKLEK